MHSQDLFMEHGLEGHVDPAMADLQPLQGRRRVKKIGVCGQSAWQESSE